LDSRYPASLSGEVITGMLRNELGYDGVIIGESPQAVFISEEYGLENAIRAQVEAGIDMLQFANNIVYDEDIAAKTIAIIKEMVENGDITEDQINASYERIQTMKSKL
jgi:beta-N-acetylhexosaminidase